MQQQEPKRTGRVFIAPNLRKEAVFLNKDGTGEPVPQDRPKTLDDLMERRRRRMGR